MIFKNTTYPKKIINLYFWDPCSDCCLSNFLWILVIILAQILIDVGSASEYALESVLDLMLMCVLHISEEIIELLTCVLSIFLAPGTFYLFVKRTTNESWHISQLWLSFWESFRSHLYFQGISLGATLLSRAT